MVAELEPVYCAGTRRDGRRCTTILFKATPKPIRADQRIEQKCHVCKTVNVLTAQGRKRVQ